MRVVCPSCNTAYTLKQVPSKQTNAVGKKCGEKFRVWAESKPVQSTTASLPPQPGATATAPAAFKDAVEPAVEGVERAPVISPQSKVRGTVGTLLVLPILFTVLTKDADCGRGEYAEEIDVVVSYHVRHKVGFAKRIARAALEQDYEPVLRVARVLWRGQLGDGVLFW